MKPLETRREEALRLRKEGYNCAQSVLLPFDDVTGLPRELAARITSGLGTGVGATREICGVVNAMALAQGMLQSPEASGKAASMKCAGSLARRFADANCGCLRCEDLKGKPGRPTCEQLVLQGVEILHRHFEEGAPAE
ncbi:MAG: C_GCAxxG_C_C family protein [Bacteroides sp.]|nr:C_GCAxxG_C_C family protein [Bacteroides sp.]